MLGPTFFTKQESHIMVENINLEILNKSRKRLRPGDIFVIKPKKHDYYFGRVVSVTAECGFGPPKAILIYIYNVTSNDKSKIPELRKENLLIPPIMLNRLGWSRGYFENVAYKELSTTDIFAVHCFRRPSRKTFMDEKGNELDGPCEPVGWYGLSSHRVVDDRVSEVLGIPLAPD